MRLLFISLPLVLASPVLATPVIYDFTAKIDLIDRFGDTQSVESGLGTLAAGSQVTGSFSYDPNTPDQDDQDFFGEYGLIDFSIDLEAFNTFNAGLSVLGGKNIDIGLPDPFFANDPFFAQDPNITFYSINSLARVGTLDFALGAQRPLTSISIDFEAPTPASDALPAELPFNSSLGPILFRIFLDVEGYATPEDLMLGPQFLGGLSAEGEITSIALRTGGVTPVPVPASALLLLGGIGVLAGLRRRST